MHRHVQWAGGSQQAPTAPVPPGGRSVPWSCPAPTAPAAPTPGGTSRPDRRCTSASRALASARGPPGGGQCAQTVLQGRVAGADRQALRAPTPGGSLLGPPLGSNLTGVVWEAQLRRCQSGTCDSDVFRWKALNTWAGSGTCPRSRSGGGGGGQGWRLSDRAWPLRPGRPPAAPGGRHP